MRLGPTRLHPGESINGLRRRERQSFRPRVAWFVSNHLRRLGHVHPRNVYRPTLGMQNHRDAGGRGFRLHSTLKKSVGIVMTKEQICTARHGREANTFACVPRKPSYARTDDRKTMDACVHRARCFRPNL